MRPDLCLTKKDFCLRISAFWNLWKDNFQVFSVITGELFLSSLCPLTDLLFIVICLLLSYSFFFFVFLFCVPLFLLEFFWACPSLSGFLGLTEFYHYCQSCDRNSIHWLMFDINCHQLLAADEVIGNVVVHGSWTCIWLLLLFKLCLSFVFLSFLEVLQIGCYYNIVRYHIWIIQG